VASRLGKVLSLTWLEWRIIACSLVLLPFCACSLRVRGFLPTLKAMVPVRPVDFHPSPQQQLALARRIARAVGIAARYGPYRATCLKKSLVLARLLQRRGIEHELKLGADFVDGDFSAHAWVEHRGIPINDDPDVGKRFASFRPGVKPGR